MQKQKSLLLALFVMALSAVPVHVSKADTSLSMNDITRVLQAEYQAQLDRSRPSSRAEKTSRRSTKAERDILADYQRLLKQAKPAKNK